jgi:hypothetical protein
MQNIVLAVAEALRKEGHQVDAFCDPRSGRYVFHWSEFVKTPEELEQYDAVSFIADPRVQRAFEEDKGWLDWAEGVVLIVPSGRSAHLEAGYAKGKGMYLWIYGEFPRGEFDVMYGFADGLYRIDDAGQLLAAIRTANASRPGQEVPA